MLNRAYLGIKYLLLVALFIMPIQAFAGGDGMGGMDGDRGFREDISDTDFSVSRLVNYWDLRDLRDTYVQVANVWDVHVRVHVQIYNVDGVTPCETCSFFDIYTPGDTHVYDVSNITRNSDGEAQTCDIEGGYGALFVSFSCFWDPVANECYSPPLRFNEGQGPLIGMFRVLDSDGGYEYRTNSASPEVYSYWGRWQNDSDWDTLNFHSNFGFSLSDVVGITYTGGYTDDTVVMSPLIGAVFGDLFGTEPFQKHSKVHIFDNEEEFNDCGPVRFSCDASLNQGIDNAHPNSKGNVARLCPTDINEGWVYMPFDHFDCLAPLSDGSCSGVLPEDDVHFTGFLGLNNGDGKGSMDSFWSTDRFKKRGHNKRFRGDEAGGEATAVVPSDS